MPRPRMFADCLPLAALVVVLAASQAIAQDFPNRPGRLIIPSSAGGLTDLIGRTVAQRFTVVSKQPFVAENRVGAGGALGGEVVAKAQPDGYTLLVAFHGLNAILPALGARMSFDPIAAFDPIILCATVPNVLVIHPSIPAHSVPELVALAKAQPGKYTFASQGIGSSGHMAGELFRIAAGIEITHVPYRGPPEAIRDLLSGEVSMMFDIVPFAMPNARSGKVRALGVATKERVAAAPELPTIAEAGLIGVEGGAWFGLYAPAKTPRPIVDWLNREARAALNEPEFRDRLTKQGATLAPGTPEEFAAFVSTEVERWRAVGRRAAIRLD